MLFNGYDVYGFCRRARSPPPLRLFLPLIRCPESAQNRLRKKSHFAGRAFGEALKYKLIPAVKRRLKRRQDTWLKILLISPDRSKWKDKVVSVYSPYSPLYLDRSIPEKIDRSRYQTKTPRPYGNELPEKAVWKRTFRNVKKKSMWRVNQNIQAAPERHL